MSTFEVGIGLVYLLLDELERAKPPGVSLSEVRASLGRIPVDEDDPVGWIPIKEAAARIGSRHDTATRFCGRHRGEPIVMQDRSGNWFMSSAFVASEMIRKEALARGIPDVRSCPDSALADDAPDRGETRR